MTQVDTVTYVSLAPGTVVNGNHARIARVGTTASLETAVIDGGFDPVSVVARAGDSIDVVITNASGIVIDHRGMLVSARRPPVVVRTQPPPGKRDHALNAAIVVVFDEPVSDASVASGSIRLLRGQNAVPGTARFLDTSLDPNRVTVEFRPDAPLAERVAYKLVVTTQVHDLSGDPLATPDTVDFTTSSSLVGPPASVRTSIDTNLVVPEGTSRQLTATVWDSAGHQLTDTPVTWSTIPDPSPVATVSATGLVHAVSPGVVIVMARAGQAAVGHDIVVPFPPPASVTITPANDTIGVGGYVVFTPTVRDSLGGDMSGTIRSICWFSSDSLVAHFGGSQDSVCFANPDYLVGYGIGVYGIDAGTVTITATVTVRPNIVLRVDTTVTGTTTLFVGGQPGVASITLTPESLTTVPSASYLLHAVVRARDGRALLDRPIEWASDAPSVATVDSTVVYAPTGELVGGAVTARGPGVATITATSGGVTATAQLKIVIPTFSSVSADYDYTCAVATGGAVFCWSGAASPKLGLGIPVVFYRPAPAQVTGGLTFSAVSASFSQACAVTADARGKCWGMWRDINGTTAFWSPQDIAPSPDGVLSLAQISRGDLPSGAGHTCGLTTAKAVYCWADILSDQPVAVSGGLGFESVSAGGGHNCAIATGGGAYCWGSNNFGQLGDGTGQSRSSPTPVAGGLALTMVTAGSLHTCAVSTIGGAYCWGRNDHGQLGDSTTTDRLSPVAVGGGLSFATLSAGANHTCGLTDTGAAYCWGWNGNGQLGDGTTTSTTSPVPVAGGLTFTSVSAGYSHTCGITTTGVLYCWGFNATGALGDGTTVDRATPVKVLGQP
ncbi:MAG: hypothetical protein AUJ01_06960 [Acidobacteria bacterium 13_1_40CM_3_65_5]|nr:MAG: hypothetical protein AUJ01_06960 [Acidobacteria bacterium 13_1_40CM_3_65_5]